MAKDIVEKLLSGIVSSAVAPVFAAVEVVAHGDVSKETRDTLLTDWAESSLTAGTDSKKK